MTNGEQPHAPPPPVSELERAKLDFEKWRAEEDFKLRRDELEVTRKEAEKSIWSSPLIIGIIGLFATVLASIVQNYVQTNANRELERERFVSTEKLERERFLSTQNQERRTFESTLVQKALESDNQLVVARRFTRLLDLGYITDEKLRDTIESWRDDPVSIPLDLPGEAFVGETRKAAKLSIATAQTETFDDLKDLIASLPSTQAMIKLNIPNGASSNRVPQENRNVHVKAYLYAASHEADNDFHLIIGRDPKDGQELYMTAEISALPPKDSPAFAPLHDARAAYEKFFGTKNLPGVGYHFYQPPIPVQIDGSLFFDSVRETGLVPGPPSLKSRMPTVWEVHPITKIKLGS